MKISHNWLKQYIDTELSPRKISEILTNTGLEVEGLEEVQSVKGGLEGVVVGEVLKCEKHPNADKLTVCSLNLGLDEPVQIVCGAPNVASGQKVPVATVGTTLWSGDEGFTIRKSKIRGELSMGMICAEDELGLGTSHEGIMVLDAGAAPGTAGADYFNIENDWVYEIGLTPNRIDGASHIGTARDLAAWLKQEGKAELIRPSVEDFKIDNTDLQIPVVVEEEAGCPRYSGLTMTGLTVKESPDWLKNRLLAIGLKPINNVVDVTNYVLHEIGQPLHAFDADEISGKKVVVKTMPEGSSFITLDEEERKLRPKDLMICNAEDGMCIAGVFGGIKSGVSEKTTSIFLESACFDPVYIRKTARHHVLNTDASFRFERGTDPNITIWALKRAALLIKEVAGGSVSSEITDHYPEPVEDFKVELHFSHVDRLIGNHIEAREIRSILEALEIRIEKESTEGMSLRVPPYRADVQREADVIEEILRIYGFNRVKTGTSLRSTLSASPKPDKEKVLNLVSEMLTSKGFYEMKSNSLTPAVYYDKSDERDPAAVRLFNPLSQDLSLMRQNLLFGGLEAIARNINRKHSDLKLYEFGSCYFMNESEEARNAEDKLSKFSEEEHMGIFLSGKVENTHWMGQGKDASFYYIKSYVQAVLDRLGISIYEMNSRGVENSAYAEGVQYMIGKNCLVVFGRIDDSLLRDFDIKQEVYAAELNWDLLMKLAEKVKIQFKQLSRFQPVKRDFSLLLNREVGFEDLRKLAFKSERKLLKKVDLFDVYEGDNIEKGKKSYALSFTLLDEEKTLTDKQIDKAMMRMARAFEQELGATVRGL